MTLRRAPLLLLLLVACKTAGTPPPELAPRPEDARVEAKRTKDPARAADLAWIYGNDRAYAGARLDEGLSKAPDDAGLHLRRALLRMAALDDAGALEDLLAIVTRTPAAPEAEAALALLSDRAEDMRADFPRIARALDEAAPAQRSAGAVALASAFRTRIAEDRARAADTFAVRGGWLLPMRAVGPLAPELLSSLATPTRHEVEAIAPGHVFRGLEAPVRIPVPSGTSIVPSAGGIGGLYVAEAFFEVGAEAANRPLELSVLFDGGGRVRVDGAVVHEKRPDLEDPPRRAVIHLSLAAGWHRLSVAMLSGTGERLAASLLTLDGRVPGKRSRAEPPEGWKPPAAAPVVEKGARKSDGKEARSELASVGPSQAEASDPFARLLGAEMALGRWSYDVERARSLVRPARARADRSAAFAALDARLMTHEGLPGSLVQARLRAALELDPANPSLLAAVAAAVARENPDQALSLADKAAALAPKSASPEIVRFRVYRERRWTAEADRALRAALEKRPTPELLDEGARFLRSLMRIPEAVELEARAAAMPSSEPEARRAEKALLAGDLEGAIAAEVKRGETGDRPQEALGRAASLEMVRGRLDAAQHYAEQALVKDPLDRPALETLAVVAARAGKKDQSLSVLERPRASGARDIDLETFAARLQGRLPGVAAPGSWLASRTAIDGPAVARAPLDPRWSTFGRVRLLDRVVDFVRDDGHVISLRHVILRVASKEAADEVGEFQLPEESLPLALRTLKADGRTVDVDRHPGKPDLSFSALAPGDSIEQQWVMMDEPALPAGGYRRRFAFQDATPNARSDLIVVVKKGTKVSWHAYNGAPEPEVRDEGGDTIYAFSKLDMPAILPEPSGVPAEEFLPYVSVSVGVEPAQAIATNVAPFETAAKSAYDVRALGVALAGSEKGEARALAIFRWVAENVRDGEPADPEVVLARRRGDRTGLTCALLRAAGFPADIVLARPYAAAILDPPPPDPTWYALPMVRVPIDGTTRWIRMDSSLPWFGQAPPDFRGASYVVASTLGPEPAGTVHRFADAEVGRWVLESKVELEVDAEGAAKGTMTLGFPGQIGQGVRVALRPLRREDVARVFQGLVSAVIPGAVLEGVDVLGADDLAPLEVRVKLAAPGFLASEGVDLVANGFFDTPIASRAVSIPSLDQYLRVGDRKTPLFVPESGEKMEIRLTLPAAPAATPASFAKETRFGTFSQSFTYDAKTRRAVLVRQELVPAQRVQPADFPAFRDLVQEIALRTQNRLVVPAPKRS